MLNDKPVGQTPQASLTIDNQEETRRAVYDLLSSNRATQLELLAAVDILLKKRHYDSALEVGKKAVLNDPFGDSFFLWLQNANIIPEQRSFLASYATYARSHFERVLKAIEEVGPLIFVDLGSSSFDYFQIPNWLMPQSHIISLDALSVPNIAEARGQRTSLHSIIGGQAAPAVFYEKYWLAASSLLPDVPEVVQAFGMEKFAQVKTAHTVATRTLAELLEEKEISRIDAIKTDLEGIDYDVIRSIEDFHSRLSFIRMELAFLPRYQGEPCFDIAHQYLTERGFSLMALKPEFWRYRTEHRDHVSKGQAIWGDFEYLSNRSMKSSLKEIVRRVLVAYVAGYANYAEYQIETAVQGLNQKMSESLKFVIFAEMRLIHPQHSNPKFPHIGTI